MSDEVKQPSEDELEENLKASFRLAGAILRIAVAKRFGDDRAFRWALMVSVSASEEGVRDGSVRILSDCESDEEMERLLNQMLNAHRHGKTSEEGVAN